MIKGVWPNASIKPWMGLTPFLNRSRSFERIFFLTISDVWCNMSDMRTHIINLKELLKNRKALVKRLGGLKHILRGSIVKQGNICGKPICKCKRKNNPVLHGPYNYLPHRSRKSRNTIFLTNQKLVIAKIGIQEYDEAIELIYRIAEINFKILRYHYARLPLER